MGTKLNLKADDFKRKSFKAAPGGTYFVRILKEKTKIEKKPKGKQITVYAKIMKGSSKGITFFDNVSASVGWKIAQLLVALGIKKPSSKLTLEMVLKKAIGADLRVQLKTETWEGKKRNKVVTWLPLKKTKDEDEDDADEDDEDPDDADDDDDNDDNDDSDDDDGDDDDSDDDDGDDDDDDSDDDDSDDDDDDEDDKPKKKGKKTKSKKSDDEDDD
jgi:hypothetical protein